MLRWRWEGVDLFSRCPQVDYFPDDIIWFSGNLFQRAAGERWGGGGLGMVVRGEEEGGRKPEMQCTLLVVMRRNLWKKSSYKRAERERQQGGKEASRCFLCAFADSPRTTLNTLFNITKPARALDPPPSKNTHSHGTKPEEAEAEHGNIPRRDHILGNRRVAPTLPPFSAELTGEEAAFSPWHPCLHAAMHRLMEEALYLHIRTTGKETLKMIVSPWATCEVCLPSWESMQKTQTDIIDIY